MGYFAIQEHGNTLEFISFADLVNMTEKLMGKRLKENKISVLMKVQMKNSYKDLKQYNADINGVNKNSVCPKCGTLSGSIIKMETDGTKTRVIACPSCMHSRIIGKFKPYKSIRGLC